MFCLSSHISRDQAEGRKGVGWIIAATGHVPLLGRASNTLTERERRFVLPNRRKVFMLSLPLNDPPVYKKTSTVRQSVP